MDVSKTTGLQPGGLTPAKNPKKQTAESNSANFVDTMKSFLKEANTLQTNAADQVESLISGETTDVHDVMIAMEKASVSFEMVMEIRNRMLEAYQEIMRTQV